MTDPDTNKDDQIWAALAAIRRAALKTPVDLESATKQLRQELFSPPMKGKPPSSGNSRIRSLVFRLFVKNEKIEACVDWLKKSGRFSNYEIKLIKRAKFLREHETGQVFMREQIMSNGMATTLVSLLFLVAGVWIGLLLSRMDTANGMDVMNALALGAVLGNIGSVILDRSFRFERIQNKVKTCAPWLHLSTFESK